ncbi:mechanosensitive ion channel protein MscS [Devosia pacifica]|uniref:Small-conductance mechanosensitive channel n=1 Tax=Devosia pacifica TaxID=1335967 RepID=A0A918S2L4_9HYPH|nr:mechanosensitive ion channel family protein [Devosia pacifica]GHA18765.1 mechanosensitive ion channel protein MscS [Devosia pacifica]
MSIYQASAQELPAEPVNEAVTVAGPVPVDADVSDAAIAQRITDIMQSTGWYRSVVIDVQQGVVIIDGVSETAAHRAWATSLAENMEGSIAVVNRLELAADFASTIDRAQTEFTRLARSALQTLPIIVLGIAIIAGAWLLAALIARISRRLLEQRIPSPLLRGVVVRVISIPVFLLGLYFVLQIAGLTRLAVTLLGGTGLVGIIVGFAFRDIAENFLASLLLSVRNPFSTGDLIEVAGETGIVANLNTRSTVLLTLDGNHVQIPNAAVFKSTIKNYSSTPTRRAEFLLGIGYDSSVAQAQLLITEILNQHPAVLDTPEPLVLVDQLGDATVNIRVSYWFDSRTYSPAKTNSALLRLSKNALLKAGIELPDPAREVVFPKGVPIVSMDNDAPPPSTTPAQTARLVPDDASETDDATAGEGNLTNETTEVRDQSRGEVIEASENLLKK